jgi:hypothetical protein
MNADMMTLCAREPSPRERLRALVGAMDEACAGGRWSEVAVLAEELAAVLPPRLGLLARSVIDYSGGEPALAVQLWAHVKDAIDEERMFALVRA